MPNDQVGATRAGMSSGSEPGGSLEEAMRVRKARARVRQAVKSGEMSVSDALYSDDPDIAGMRAKALLLAMPGVGKARAKAMLEAAGAAENRRVRGLGIHQKAAIAALAAAHMEDLARKRGGHEYE